MDILYLVIVFNVILVNGKLILLHLSYTQLSII